MNTKYKRYIIVGIILMYLFSLQPSICSLTEENDVLDQSQTHYSYDAADVDMSQRWAQSFIPSVAIVTRAKLYLSNVGSINDITLSIRKNLEEQDLTSISLSSSHINISGKHWIEFNFDDISVTPGDTYYIVCEHISKKPIQWAASDDNLYLDGKAFSQEIQPDGKWMPWEDDMPFPYSVDFCFKTYGRYHPPNKPLEPKGPNQLRINQIGQYTTTTDDLDGDQIRYGWDWNDDDIVDYWTSYYESGEMCTVNHSWTEKGNVLIKVIAEDIDGYQSSWSFSKSLAVPFEKITPEINLRSILFKIFNNLFLNIHHFGHLFGLY